MCEVGDEDGGLVHGEHGAAHAGHVISEGANKAAVVLSPHQACTQLPVVGVNNVMAGTFT